MEPSKQKELFERIHDEYERHYYDSESLNFRNLFIYDVIFDGIDMTDWEVADLASGSGHNSLALHSRYSGIKTTGFDVSSRACKAYRRTVGGEAVEIDLTKPYQGEREFDAAIIIGGLHHCVNNIQTAINNIGAMVKSGGWVLMMEPNRQYLFDLMRRFWYRLDKNKFDAANEAALNHDDIILAASSNFQLHDVKFLGGPAYFLILQSMILGIPPSIKQYIAPPLFRAERMYNRLPGRFWFPYFIARWRKNL